MKIVPAKTANISLVALFAALTAAGAFIRFPLPPVPITLQSLFVLMSGMILGARAGALSQSIYIIIGLMGFPIFSGGGGPSYILKPSFGYLLGFIAASYTSGLIFNRRKTGFFNTLLASMAGSSAIYLIGIPWLAIYMRYLLDKPDALLFSLQTGLVVFLPGDILKCLILAIIVPRLRHRTSPG